MQRKFFLFLRHFYDKKIVSKSIQPEAILSDIILLVYYDDFSGFFNNMKYRVA